MERFDAPVDVADRIDLHLHSNRSDGLLEPVAVIEAAKEAGLKALALTDHDTLAGIEEAQGAAAELDIPFVPGVEFSCYDESGSTHLLGYFIDPGHSELVQYLEEARERRLLRAERMVEKLNRLGVELTLDEVRAQTSQDGLIARPHVARALVAGGWVQLYNEAFWRFLAAGQPAYVPTWRISPAEGIRWIHEAGGLAVLAHGGKSHTELGIRALADEGLDGLETLHPEHGPYEVGRLRRLVAQLGLLETGGSDWHGPQESRRGQLASQPVPYEWYLRLRDAAGK
ncbi:MAG: PHP domain-containing protein [Gemmatimonadota bacterium]|nr:MAG: PHP domain-containing protein [Gemmatimonadota bacterium]